MTLFETNFGSMGKNPNITNVGAFVSIQNDKRRKSVNMNSPFYVGKNNIKRRPNGH